MNKTEIIINNHFVTTYKNETIVSKATILYFHGGGFLFGTKEDLPSYHIQKLCEAGYIILCFNYRLAPANHIDDISLDVISSIQSFLQYRKDSYPYFLWGRSAGAYLSLYAGSYNFTTPPLGIISYYGYGFLTPLWYVTPSSHYCGFPIISYEDAISNVTDKETWESSAMERYKLYLYARQSGKWLSLITNQNISSFLSSYSLKDKITKNYPAALLVHASKDTDVPFEESKELSMLLPNATLYPVLCKEHDFDRTENSIYTKMVIKKTIEFIELQLIKNRTAALTN